MLINWLLMACGHHHFEARQRLEAPECRHHLNTAIWPKSVEPVQKHVNKCEQRIIPEQNAIILLKWHTSISVWTQRKLRRGLKMAQILMLKSNYNPCQSRECSYDVKSIWVFSIPPSNLASGAAVMTALQ